MGFLSKMIRQADREGNVALQQVLDQVQAHPALILPAGGLLGTTRNGEKREQLLGRVSDVIRRSGVEDAEELIRELETRLR